MIQFVFTDVMVSFLAIRSGEWELRVASVKSMAAVFTAFDRTIYQKLISQHLRDIASMPPQCFGMVDL